MTSRKRASKRRTSRRLRANTAAKLDLRNSTTRPYKFRWVEVPVVGRVPADNVEADDSFPPAVKKYEILDGWLHRTNHDGVEGVVLGTWKDLLKWMADVDKENRERPVLTEPWSPEKHGGEQHVRDTLSMAEKTLRRFGLDPVQMDVWVDTRAMASSSASSKRISFVNIHDGHNEKILSQTVPWAKSVGAHEASHVGFIQHRDRGQYVLDTLKWREDHGRPSISDYHALSGHFEGIAEAGAAYTLIPEVLATEEPELYAACAYWFGDGPEPKDLR